MWQISNKKNKNTSLFIIVISLTLYIRNQISANREEHVQILTPRHILFPFEIEDCQKRKKYTEQKDDDDDRTK